MNEIYEKNMEALREKDKAVYEIIKNASLDTLRYQIIKTKTEEDTIQITCADIDHIQEQKFLLHGKYDPYRSESSFIEKNYNVNKKSIVLYGFGLGYHIDILLQKITDNQNLYIIEANIAIVKLAFIMRDLSNIIAHERTKIILISDQNNLKDSLTLLNDEDTSLLIHQSSVKAIPHQYKGIGNILNDIKMMKWGIEKNKDVLLDNYFNNIKIKSPNICNFFGKFKSLPIIIVSAGPSLNQNKHLLYTIKDRALIFSVGSALKTLVKEGIVPHLFCITDPQPITYKQIEGYENLSVPLVFLDTASHYTISRYCGPKYIVYNEQERINDNEQVIETGGSVATAILDMAIKFGGGPIVFIGQDLAFTDYEHHSEGNMYGEEKMVKDLPNLKKVKGHRGEIYPTSSSLLSFKNWIERKIENHPEILFINATEKGAFIKGCQHITLQDTIDLYLKKENDELERFLELCTLCTPTG